MTEVTEETLLFLKVATKKFAGCNSQPQSYGLALHNRVIQENFMNAGNYHLCATQDNLYQ